MFKKTRRFITGIDDTGHSKLLTDEDIATLIPYPQYPCFQLQNLFFTEDSPQSMKTRTSNEPYTINLSEGSMRFIKIRMPTQAEMINDLQNNNETIPNDWRKFNVHSTDSIDYIYVLSGKITCVVGDESLDLSEGDFLTQIGTEHVWINPHVPCYILGIMVGINSGMARKKMYFE